MNFSLLFSNDWSLSITGQDALSIGQSHTIHFGTCEGCSDGFQYGEDEYDYFNPFVGEYTDIHFFHLDWYGTAGDNGVVCEETEFATDYKAWHSHNELITWGIRGNASNGISEIPILLSWDLSAFDSLSSDYEVYIYIGGMGFNMRSTNSVSVAEEALYLNENYEPNVTILMGACASSGTTTHYLDSDLDGWGSNINQEFCLGHAPEGWVINNEDINDEIVCNSNLIDNCNICDGFNQDMDCHGDCFGNAFNDDCGMCSGGNTNHIENSDKDCNNDCFGSAFIDDCGICSEGNTNHIENSDQDCSATCFGNAIIDDCNACVNSNFNQSCLEDLFGNGPEDAFAYIDDNIVNISWEIPNTFLNEYITTYNIYYLDRFNNYILLGSTNSLHFIDSEFGGGTYCITALDQYANESSMTCIESTEMCAFNWELHPGPNLISFPCIPDDNSVENISQSLESTLIGVIGEGSATTYIDDIGWIGGLLEVTYTSGYWFLIAEEAEFDTEYGVIGIPNPINLSYIFSGSSIYLISYQGVDDMNISEAIPDNVEPYITNIIGEGNAAIQINGNWYGSLMRWKLGSGYWINVTEPIVFRWENGSNRESVTANMELSIPTGYEYSQSTKQAFYFIESIQLDNNLLPLEGWIISYHNNIVTGVRQWSGNMIDVPVMGNDGNAYSQNYFESGNIPQFKFLDKKTGDLINLQANNIPQWENNKVFIINTLQEKTILPRQVSLNTYPNPFNPITTLSYTIPSDGIIQLSIYNLAGQQIDNLIHEYKNKGQYSINWNATNYPSGVYFAHMQIEHNVFTQKLILMK